MEPLANFNYIYYERLRQCARISGNDLFDINWKPTLYTIVFASLIFVFPFLGVYSICVDNDLFAICLPLISISLQVSIFSKIFICHVFTVLFPKGLVKFFSVSIQRNKLRQCIEFLKYKIYVRNQKKNNKNYRSLKKWSDTAVYVVKGTFVLGTCTSFAFILWPVVEYLLHGNLPLILEIHIPGISDDGFGYCILTTYHVFISIAGVLGTIGSDLLFIFFIYHTLPMNELFSYAIKRLEVNLEKKKEFDVQSHLNNIIVMHQEMCR